MKNRKLNPESAICTPKFWRVSARHVVTSSNRLVERIAIATCASQALVSTRRMFSKLLNATRMPDGGKQMQERKRIFGSFGAASSRWRGNLASLFTRLGKPDRDRLLATLCLARSTAALCPLLRFVNRLSHFFLCSRTVLGHCLALVNADPKKGLHGHSQVHLSGRKILPHWGCERQQACANVAARSWSFANRFAWNLIDQRPA